MLQQFGDIRKDNDFIIGHRNHREDGISRVFVTMTLKLVLKLGFGVEITDADLSNAVLSVIYARKKQKIKYIPITFRPRQGGVNSINLKKIFGIGKKAVADFKEINRNFKEYNI